VHDYVNDDGKGEDHFSSDAEDQEHEKKTENQFDKQ
jgi:hypothetical protein